MNIKKVAVLGGGVLGSQIAFQSAYCGFDVTIWSLSSEDKKEAMKKLNDLKDSYIKTIDEMYKKESWALGISDPDSFNKKKCLEKVNSALDKINIVTDLKEAVKDCELVIESIIENLDIKRDFYKRLSGVLDKDSVVVTNSSTIIPSKLAKSTGRESKFLSLHFANSIWKNNTAEVMKHSKTDDKCFDIVMKFAKDINMIALPLYKEKSGYLLNSMLIPLLFSAMDLLVNDISDIESIDTAWVRGTGAPKGPFQILDIVGLKTAYNIVLMYLKIPSFLAPYNFKGMEKILKKYIDESKLGVATGEGFYKYK